MSEPNDTATLLALGNAQSLQLIDTLCQTPEGRRALAYYISTLLDALRQYESLLAHLSGQGESLRAHWALQRNIFDELRRAHTRLEDDPEGGGGCGARRGA